MKRITLLMLAGLMTSVQAFASSPELPRVEYSHCAEQRGCRSCIVHKNGRVFQEMHLGCLGLPLEGPRSVADATPMELFQAPLAPADSSWRSFLPEMKALAFAVSYVMAPSTWKAESKWVDTNLARFKDHLTQETRRIEDTWKEAQVQWAQTEPSSVDLAQGARSSLQSLRARAAAFPPQESPPPVAEVRAETRFVEQVLAREAGLTERGSGAATPFARERERLSRLSGGELRQRASLVLDAAERFGAGSGSGAEVSGLLFEEARSTRHCAAGLGSSALTPTYDRVVRFEARVSEVEARREAIRSRLEQESFDIPSSLRAQETVRIAGELNSEARETFYSGELAEGETLVSLAQSVLDVAIGVIPGVNVGRDVYELFSGQNLVTGEALSTGEYAFAAVGVLTLGVSDEVSVVGRAVMKAARGLAPEAKSAVRAAVNTGSDLVETAAGVLGRSAEGLSNFFGIARSEAEFVNSPVAREAIREIRYPAIWTKGELESSVGNAYRHFRKHREEFPWFQNALQYVEGAHDFMRSPPAGTWIKYRPNGEKVFLDPSSRIFAVQSSEGAPKTMYVLDSSKELKEYFNAQ